MIITDRLCEAKAWDCKKVSIFTQILAAGTGEGAGGESQPCD